jgi:hypothetical protein
MNGGNLKRGLNGLSFNNPNQNMNENKILGELGNIFSSVKEDFKTVGQIIDFKLSVYELDGIRFVVYLKLYDGITFRTFNNVFHPIFRIPMGYYKYYNYKKLSGFVKNKTIRINGNLLTRNNELLLLSDIK